MRLIPQQEAADYLGVCVRTIRNMISKGELTGYQIPGVRAVRVDRDQLMSLPRAIPTATGGVPRYRKPKFGGNVVRVNRPVIVDDGLGTQKQGAE